jgi:hypothetical protein
MCQQPKSILIQSNGEVNETRDTGFRQCLLIPGGTFLAAIAKTPPFWPVCK